MSDKPSLYVVEKKEVVILVVLFVLVTVLSFTLGVRYGESVGRKAAHEQELAASQHGEEKTEVGGSLGKAHKEEPQGKAGDHSEHKAPAHDDHGGKADGHGTDPKAEHKDSHGDEHKTEPAHGSAAQDSHSPEAAAAKAPSHSPGAQPSHEQIDKKSDDYLLNALKDAGVEPPGGKAPHGAKLPDSVKEVKREVKSRVHSGSFVIQVGSHPTRDLAEAQVGKLKARKVQAEVLPPFKDHQGEWHRVVIGSFKNKREADREAGGLKGKGSIASYFVWRLP